MGSREAVILYIAFYPPLSFFFFFFVEGGGGDERNILFQVSPFRVKVEFLSNVLSVCLLSCFSHV